MSGPDGLILLFDTTHLAMEAEEAIVSRGVWCDVVPRPPGTSAGLCGLAIKIEASDQEGVSLLLKEAGIRYDVFKAGKKDET